MPKRHTTPAVVERCVARVAERLLPERGPRGALSGAYAICTAQAQRRGVLRPGTRALTAAGRAADRSARRRPGLARAERAVARIARDARKANGAAAPPWLDRSLPYYPLALDQIHRDDRPATAALNAADRSRDRDRIARAEARYARVAATREARVEAYARELYANDVENGLPGASRAALEAFPAPAAPRKRNGAAHDALARGVGNDTGVTRPLGAGYTLRVERYRDAVRVHLNTEGAPGDGPGGAELARRRGAVEEAAAVVRRALSGPGRDAGIDATPGPWTVHADGEPAPAMHDVYAAAGAALRGADLRSRGVASTPSARKPNGAGFFEVRPLPLYRLRLERSAAPGADGVRLLSFDTVLRDGDYDPTSREFSGDYARRRRAMREAIGALARRLDPSGARLHVDATPGFWTLYLPPDVVRLADGDVARAASEEVRAADAASRDGRKPNRAPRKRNGWPHEPPRASAVVDGTPVDFDASRDREAYGAVVNWGAHEVRGHFATEPGGDPRLPAFVTTAVYRVEPGTGRRLARQAAAGHDLLDHGISARHVEQVLWAFRERLLSPELCAGTRAPRRHDPGSCPDVRLLSADAGGARDSHDLRLGGPWPEGATSLYAYVNRQRGGRAMPVPRRKPNRYTVSRDDDSRSRPFAVFDARGEVVHRAATRAEADEVAAEENRVLAAKAAARGAR